MSVCRNPLLAQALFCIRALLCCVLLSACFPGVYKLDIPQGNMLEAKQIDQLQVGMTKRQVRYLLGTPLLIDSFNQDRWIYYYSLKYYRGKDAEGAFYEGRVVVLFDKGLVTDINKQLPNQDSDEDAARDALKEEVVIPEAAQE